MTEFRLVQRGNVTDGVDELTNGQILMEGLLGEGITTDMIVRAVRRGRCGVEKVPEEERPAKGKKRSKKKGKKPTEDSQRVPPDGDASETTEEKSTQ